MGKKYFIRSSQQTIEDKIKSLQAEVARLSQIPRVAVYSPPEPVQATVIPIEEKLDLPPIEDEAVFIPAPGTHGAAELKTVQKKVARFEIKDIEALKAKSSGKVK